MRLTIIWSDDGEVIYDVFAKFGYEAVRGSTTRGGVPALKQLIKLLGQKTGQGFYKKIDKGIIHSIDFNTMKYTPQNRDLFIELPCPHVIYKITMLVCILLYDL